MWVSVVPEYILYGCVGEDLKGLSRVQPTGGNVVLWLNWSSYCETQVLEILWSTYSRKKRLEQEENIAKQMNKTTRGDKFWLEPNDFRQLHLNP